MTRPPEPERPAAYSFVAVCRPKRGTVLIAPAGGRAVELPIAEAEALYAALSTALRARRIADGYLREAS
jgi:hypothetical protein